MTRTTHTTSNDEHEHEHDSDLMQTALVECALGIHRNIAACHAHIACGGGVHALTAALMLPCYRAEFRKLVQSLSSAQERELRTALEALHESACDA
ncbi:hypothetical protein J2W23_005199 [Variovorax boronicumulans]|uniref:hypothetical protein n=1 Tax=Variovorax boronicumulans TaxID=436515 RepID=UPI002787B5BE|nr:hypothetical protein [Variovorax boronicumulans]MDQ0016791.1 hypothetical protein [Variovorax boronicumulans]